LVTSLKFDQFFLFFGLRQNPFHVSPDPRFYYSSPGHDAAFSELLFSIQTRQGITVLTGEAGTGKTTLVHRLLDWLRDRNLSSAYVFHSLLRPNDLFEFIAHDFGIPCASSEKGDLVDALHKWLIRRHAAGDTPVVIIDEAQALSMNTLDELRLLLNLETTGGKLMHIVLVGQPELDQKLQRHQLRQLRQRVMFRCRLPLLTSEQTAQYVAARMAAAGAPDSHLFPQDTIRALHVYARGIPRVINLLCEHALLGAYADQHSSITALDIYRIAAKFDLSHDPLPGEDLFQSFASAKLALFPSSQPPAAEVSAPVGSQQETEIVPIFPVPTAVPKSTVPQSMETIPLLTVQPVTDPSPPPPSVSDPLPPNDPPTDLPPITDPPPSNDPPAPIQEPNPPVENAALAATKSPANFGSLVDPDSPFTPSSKRVVFGPKRLATARECVVSTPGQVASAPKRVFSASKGVVLVSSRVFSASKQVVSASTQLPSSSIQIAPASNQLALTANQVPTTSNQVAPISNHLALASRRVASPQLFNFISRYCRRVAVSFVRDLRQLLGPRHTAPGPAALPRPSAPNRATPPRFATSIALYFRQVADSFIQDLRQWFQPSDPARPADPQYAAMATASADSPDLVPIAPKLSASSTVRRRSPAASMRAAAARKRVVISISKWLREPMAPSLQARESTHCSDQSRTGRHATNPTPRSAQKS
jgi:general secretion pathway protein A